MEENHIDEQECCLFMQSIPRQIWLDKGGKRLIQWPIQEVEKLRGHKITTEGENLASGSILEVSGITASQVSC